MLAVGIALKCLKMQSILFMNKVVIALMIYLAVHISGINHR